MDELRPVFVLAGGQRCGSTLIQRLLIASRRIWCWGEHAGLLQDLIKADDRMRRWKVRADRDQAASFDQGRSLWIPNMTPTMDWWRHSIRSFMTEWLGAGAARRGYERWGFKETRYGESELAWLRGLFPESQIIVIVRHPAACLRSVKAQDWYSSEWGGAPRFLAAWAHLTESLWTACDRYDQCLRLRYEDLIADPHRVLAGLADFLGLQEGSLPATMIAHRVGAAEQNPAALNRSDEEALRHRDVMTTSAMIGYEMK